MRPVLAARLVFATGAAAVFFVTVSLRGQVPDPPTPAPPVSSLTITPASPTVAPGRLIKLTASGGTGPYVWVSPDDVDIGEAGCCCFFVAVKPGRYKMTVVAGGTKAEAFVRVGDPPPAPNPGPAPGPDPGPRPTDPLAVRIAEALAADPAGRVHQIKLASVYRRCAEIVRVPEILTLAAFGQAALAEAERQQLPLAALPGVRRAVQESLQSVAGIKPEDRLTDTIRVNAADLYTRAAAALEVTR